MYLTSEAFRLMKKQAVPEFTANDWKILDNYKKHIDLGTKFIPGWVKVAVAMALGLGTMVGWKRIVVTVGEKIGNDHLTYGQGAAAEITARGDDRGSRLLRVASQHNARAVVRCRRHNDGEQVWPSA